MTEYFVPCSHCEQRSMIVWYQRWEYCYKCGYDNDRKYPIRHKHEQKAIDAQVKQELVDIVNALRPDYSTTRWHDKPSVDDDETSSKKREAQLRYRANHKDEINQRRREARERTKSLNAIHRVQA